MNRQEKITVTVTKQLLVDIFATTVFAAGQLSGNQVAPPPPGFDERIDNWMRSIVNAHPGTVGKPSE